MTCENRRARAETLPLSVECADGPPPDLASARELTRWLDGNGDVCARVYSSAATRWIDWHNLGRFAVDPERNQVRAWPAPGVSSSRLRDQFNRRIQHLILQARNYQALHASGIQIGSTAIGFAGASGSGKSTLARALDGGDSIRIADDALLLDIDGEKPVVLTLPFIPGLPAGPQQQLVLAAVFILERSIPASHPRLDRLTGPAACLALMKHAHMFDPADEHARFLTTYAAVANRVPVFQLTYRPVLEELPALTEFVRGVLDDLLA